MQAVIPRLAFLLLLIPAFACGFESEEPSDDVAVEVDSVTLDPRTNSPVLLLRENGGERMLPIWIGFAEAQSIATELEALEPPRPNTHDLAHRILVGLDSHVVRVTVTDLRAGTYYAVLELSSDGKTVQIDSRPSDAIAIALRASAPVFVREWLFEVGAEEEDPEGQRT